MTRKVYTWKEAVRAGYDPSLYTYMPATPGGMCCARLDFKMWAKKIVAINACFTMVESDRLQFQVTVYPTARSGYRIGPELFDVFRCQSGMQYRIEVVSDKAGRWVLQNMLLLPSD